MPFANRRVGYFYDPDVGNFYYAQGHPMKPHRMRMTHNLLLAYNMIEKMDILTSPRASDHEMTRFHSDEYIEFLRVVTPDNMAEHHNQLSRFNILEDCPVFDGLWEYCQIAAGGSLAGAARLNAGESDTVINWAGGLHHAKRSEASGFCYINDCVLAILELLKLHARVLYVDIDIHHGDGVEEAFYTTDRVMTVSFHKYGDYFPGTGDVSDSGIERGKNYCVNFPLKDGIDDESYREIFMPVMSKVMEWFRPGAVVLQCGADSLSGDRLGCFNLSLKGHAQCVDFFDRYNVPLLLLGGGGYTIRNVARCWAYETSRVLNADISDELPYNDNYEFYGPEFRLHIATNNMENQNTREYLEKTKARILEQLRNIPHAPSAPLMDVPRSSPLGVHVRDYDSDNDDPDVRKKSRRAKRVQEYEDSDDDDDDDQYLTSLPVARRKVRKSTFPRRSVLRTAQRTTSTNSPSNLLAAANQAYHSTPSATNAANGATNQITRTGLLVNSKEFGTAATSDERVERGPRHAHDDNVDSSRAGKRKDDEKAAAVASIAKRLRASDNLNRKAEENLGKHADDPEAMDVSEPKSSTKPNVTDRDSPSGPSEAIVSMKPPAASESNQKQSTDAFGMGGKPKAEPNERIKSPRLAESASSHGSAPVRESEFKSREKKVEEAEDGDRRETSDPEPNSFSDATARATSPSHSRNNKALVSSPERSKEREKSSNKLEISPDVSHASAANGASNQTHKNANVVNPSTTENRGESDIVPGKGETRNASTSMEKRGEKKSESSPSMKRQRAAEKSRNEESGRASKTIEKEAAAEVKETELSVEPEAKLHVEESEGKASPPRTSTELDRPQNSG